MVCFVINVYVLIKVYKTHCIVSVILSSQGLLTGNCLLILIMKTVLR